MNDAFKQLTDEWQKEHLRVPEVKADEPPRVSIGDVTAQVAKALQPAGLEAVVLEIMKSSPGIDLTLLKHEFPF